MLFGFPLDYWNHESIQSAIASFARVLLWENDRGFLTRLLIKARVTYLQDIPHFIIVSEGGGSSTSCELYSVKSWTKNY
jgi:hypothetical protein